MKLSNKGRYGVRAIFDIAFHNEGKPTHIRDISERQTIPPRFLEQIFQDLKRAGLVTSKRGPKGGYALAKEANDITLGDIIRALEGPIMISDPKERAKFGDDTSKSVTEEFFQTLSKNIENCFDSICIQDLCDRGIENGISKKPPKQYVYMI